jgi:hypothetical protein
MQFFNFKCEQAGPATQISTNVAAASAAQNNKCQELAAIAELHRAASIKEQSETFWIPRSVVKAARQHGSYKF